MIAEAIAERFGAEIISVDSMQIYRRMDIGTAKPSDETRRRIRHHMIDIAEPSDDVSVTEFQTAAREILDAAEAEDRFVIVGGSGLHFRSIVDPMTFAPTDDRIRADIEAMAPEDAVASLVEADPIAPDVVDMANPRRVTRALEIMEITGDTPSVRAARPEAIALKRYEPVIGHVSIGIDAGEYANARADARFIDMMEEGLLDEVASLVGVMGRNASQAVGYRELARAVSGVDTIETAVTRAKAATRQLIKRQRTFFGRDPRIAWMPWQDDAEQRIEAVMAHVERETTWTS